MSSRDLGLGALMALLTAVVLDKTGPTVGFNAFCIGILFGLAIGVGTFALPRLGASGCVDVKRMRGR